MIAWLAAAALAAPALSGGVIVGDPFGVVGRIEWNDTRAVQVIAGARLLCPEGARCGVPGPLLAADAMLTPSGFVRWNLGTHVGAGVGVGWVEPGCWVDAIAEFCVERRTPSVLARVPIGFDGTFGRFELGIDVVPALRIVPDLYFTVMGGLQVRYVFREY